MITYIYLGIALIVFVSTLYNLIFKEEKLADQINAGMILIPLAGKPVSFMVISVILATSSAES